MDNIVGSLTQLQQSVIIGTLLGDGHLRTFKGRKNALLEINHSFKQKDYVDWKYGILENVSASPPKARNGNGKRTAYRFHSRQLPELSKFHQLFYGSGVKKIPKTISLNSIILSVWYMDDGSRCSDEDFYLNTQQYSLEDQNRLIAMLKEIGLETRLNKDKLYWRIRFITSSLPRLKELIAPHLIPSMYYKLGYNPVETEAVRPRVAVKNSS